MAPARQAARDLRTPRGRMSDGPGLDRPGQDGGVYGPAGAAEEARDDRFGRDAAG